MSTQMPSSWPEFYGLPPGRSWITYAELREALGKEGIYVTRDLVRKAVASEPPADFHGWKCYEARHVELIRRYVGGAGLDEADADDSKRIVRVGGAVAPSTEVGHTHGGNGA